MPPLNGRPRLGHNVVVGYYAQGHESIKANATVIQEIFRIDPLMSAEQARSLLGRFLFSGDDVFKQVSDLSGGERSRVALAQLTLQTSNFLILDEPTNHLDVDAREALESVLTEYDGSILFVSHDRYFIDALADKLWVISDGQVVEHLGNYSDYASKVEKQRQAGRADRTSATAEAINKKAERKGHALAQNGRSTAIEKANKKRLAELEVELARIEREMAGTKTDLDAASVAQDVASVTNLGRRYVELQQMYDQVYDEWADLESIDS
jgi:ATP-binding cassette subfamily F protein 3